MNTYCADFILVKDCQVVLEGFSEHVWIKTDREGRDWLHFAADSMGSEAALIEALDGIGYQAERNADGWWDILVPMTNVHSLRFGPELD